MLLLILIVAILGDCVLIYISSLYAPNWFWALAYSILIGIIALGFFGRNYGTSLWAPAILGSIIINSHFMFNAFITPGFQIVGWAVMLFVAQSILLFLIVRLASKVIASDGKS